MTDTILTFIVDHGYLAVFVLMVLESACIPIPSEVTMLVGGALCNAAFVAQVNGDPLNVVVVGLVGTIANLIGSWIAWGVGYKGGRPLVEKWGRHIHLNTKHLDKAEVWFDHRGQASVFFTRLLPVVRTFISLPAGIARMHFGKFTLYTVLGCLPWTMALAFLGQALGGKWADAEHAMKPLTYLVAAALLGGAIYVFVKRRNAPEDAKVSI